ncbi:NYN domain-containing protein [Candidatus Uhrbacteria bacterium]|nr:NYN domain-containing protein [Candidatus Uhrbacteria bacterium]
MIQYPSERVAVFIDTQNMYYSARNIFGQKVNFGNIVSAVVGDRQILRATAYVVSTKTGEEGAFFEALQKSGIDTKEKQLAEYFSGIKKADWDVGITVDAIAILDMVDVIVLVSGDGDFIPLARYVQSRGRRFEVAAFRETTSSQLVEVVDRYVNLSEDKRKFLIGKSRKPAQKMTRGGEALVEMDQADNLPADMPSNPRVVRPRRVSF